MEALALTASCYDYLHKYLDDASYTRPSICSSPNPIDILGAVANDERFDGIFDKSGPGNMSALLEDHEDLVLEHWNALTIVDQQKQFEDTQYAAVVLLTTTQGSETSSYDFFIVHLLTTSHAVRVLLPYIPARFHVPLLRQWWLLTLGVYICQLRPKVEINAVLDYDLAGRDWTWTMRKTLGGRWATDPHYVKAIRAIQVASDTWGDPKSFYLKAAVKFASDFNGWF